MAVAEDAAAAWAIALELDKAVWRAGKKVHRKAQELGMRYQNWRHKGVGSTTLAAAAGVPATTSGKPGKNWSTDEESFSNTTTSHTTYTRKRTR